jgi:hypothetical protein
VITATASTPAAISVCVFSNVMPPIATIGQSRRDFASRYSADEARGAPGLVVEGKALPNAT